MATIRKYSNTDVAVGLLLVVFLLVLTKMIISYPSPPPRYAIMMVLVVLIHLGIITAVWKRVYWIKWVLLILNVPGAVVNIVKYKKIIAEDPINSIITVAIVILNLAATYLVWTEQQKVRPDNSPVR